jgi:tetratricopeptide (TPR) repeat protein
MPNEIEQTILRACVAQQESRLADARSEWRLAVELSREQDDRPQLARALRSLGEVERKLHDRSAARLHYEEAVALYRGLSEPLALAHTVRHLGDLYCESSLPELAQSCYHEAIEVYRAHPEAAPLDVANAIRSTAVLASERGETVRARKLWQEARELYRVAGIQEGIAESSARLAGLAGN